MMPRIIRHEAGPQSGSYEVRFADGRESKFFYFGDMPARRPRPEMLTSEQALQEAKALGWGKMKFSDDRQRAGLRRIAIVGVLAQIFRWSFRLQ
jgi:hypothetical protein